MRSSTSRGGRGKGERLHVGARPLRRAAVPEPTLLLTASLALASALAFSGVGLVASRRAPPQGTLASVAFPAFWHSAAVVYASQGLRALAAYLGRDTWPLVVALEQLSTPFYCIAAASLAYYVLYLLTERAWLALPVACYYLVMLVVLRYHVQSAGPIGYVVTEWQVHYVYERPLQSAGYSVALGLASAPIFAAIAGYLALALRLQEPTLQWRIAWVGAGLALWIGVEVLAFATGLATTPEGELLRRGCGLATAAIVAVGYARSTDARAGPRATPE